MMIIAFLQYLQVHLFETDEHPSDESLPKPYRNKAHLHKALQSVVGLLAEAMDVHGWLVGKKVGQQIATVSRKGKMKTTQRSRSSLVHIWMDAKWLLG